MKRIVLFVFEVCRGVIVKLAEVTAFSSARTQVQVELEAAPQR